MSLFRHASAWTLRALVLWGAIELGAALYDRGTEAAQTLVQVSSHRDVMRRLDERAQDQEAQAAALEARQTAVRAPSMVARSPSEAALMIRDHLLQAGAQAPVVEFRESNDARAAAAPLPLAMSWREPRDSAAQAFYALAQRFPELGVARLEFETHGEVVHAEGDFTVALAPVSEGAP